MDKESNKCVQCGADCNTGELCGRCQNEATLDSQFSCGAGEHPTLDSDVAGSRTVSGPRFARATSLDNEVGDYELLEEIARGGMGVVYKARHRKLQRIAAIKMILGGRFSSDHDIRRFYVEAEAAARLDHPSIVPVYEISEHEGHPFFVMKFVEGGSLARHRDRIRQTPERMARILAKVARAIHHAHQRGILHRDIKPANILLDEEDNPLVTDLGLAKSTSEDSSITHTGAVVGTPSYMPPEQAQAGGTLTTAADIYSLGAILYEMLTGQPPHQGDSAVETVMHVLHQPIQPPRSVDNQVNRDLELICMKCLAREPDARYASAAELADDLERWAGGEPISVRPPTRWALAASWLRYNRRIGYAVLALLAGCACSFPVILSVLGALDNPAALYQNTPEDPRPLLYSFTSLPNWVSTASAVFVAMLWPMLGLLSALVTRPPTWKRALWNGAVVGSTCGILFAVLLGWVFFMLTAQARANQAVHVLSQNVWPVDSQQAEEAGNAALALAPGLEELPVEERANFLTKRIFADVIAIGPMVWIMVALVSIMLSTPIVYGTVIGQALLSRKNAWWILGPRYLMAWAMSTMSLFFVGIWVINDKLTENMFVSGRWVTKSCWWSAFRPLRS